MLAACPTPVASTAAVAAAAARRAVVGLRRAVVGLRHQGLECHRHRGGRGCRWGHRAAAMAPARMMHEAGAVGGLPHTRPLEP